MTLQADLRGLHEKYDRLHALRISREAYEAEGITELEGAPRSQRNQQVRDLVARFPGAMRECEFANAQAMARRRAEVQRVLGGSDRRCLEAADLWMAVGHDFHRTVAGILMRRKGEALDEVLGLRTTGWLGDEGAWVRCDIRAPALHTAAGLVGNYHQLSADEVLGHALQWPSL